MILKHARVLVVDDEPEVLFALKLLLKREVREVVMKKNPELLRSLLRQPCAVVLLDLNYPCCPPWESSGTTGAATGNDSARKVTFLSVSACAKR
jgi:CheY-like chemotaxis protein